MVGDVLKLKGIFRLNKRSKRCSQDTSNKNQQKLPNYEDL